MLIVPGAMGGISFKGDNFKWVIFHLNIFNETPDI